MDKFNTIILALAQKNWAQSDMAYPKIYFGGEPQQAEHILMYNDLIQNLKRIFMSILFTFILFA